MEMEHNAAALQTMYRQTFARTNLTLKDSEQIDNPQRV